MADAEDPSKKYDQAFFLDLAAKGKDEWNAWRRDPANQDVHVNFAGIDFSEAPDDKINFTGFEFGDKANFSRCKWDFASFSDAVFGHYANFGKAVFGHYANFRHTAFGEFAGFTGSVFGDDAHFTRAAFEAEADFIQATFGFTARFTGATFGDIAHFTGATFGGKALFTGAAFGGNADFSQTHFKGEARVSGMSEEQWAGDFKNVDSGPSVTLKQRHKESWKRTGTGPGRFLFISYAKARFDGEADFSGRSFEQIADFTCARFTTHRISMPRPMWAGSTSPAPIFVLFPGANSFIVPRTAVSRCCCALFEKSRRKLRTTISNAISISRNGKQNAASIGVNCPMSGKRHQKNSERN
jgi:hypothetical protein